MMLVIEQNRNCRQDQNCVRIRMGVTEARPTAQNSMCVSQADPSNSTALAAWSTMT